MIRHKTRITRPRHRQGELPREEGACRKDWGGRLPIALAYPNSYYLGMSNLGIHAVYRLLNREDSVVCERVFREGGNGEGKTAVLSVESRRRLTDFAVIAFSISYELDYFNVVSILKASGIPLRAVDRDERHPLVIAGGPCVAANPMPLSPFFDCLCIGEAEAILPKMLPVLEEGIGGRRDELLKTLASLPGVYVPQYNGRTVARQRVANLDDFPVTSVILTPDTELGDLYLIEVQRGCNWSCRFCLVSTVFSPARFRSVGRLLETAEEGLKYRPRLGLVGPAVSDHPQLEELLTGLLRMGAKFAISSLRVNRLSDRILEAIARGGARTITIAPEAGSERLRQVIKKDIGEEDVRRVVGKAAELGIKQIKLYFMVGLPSETDEDIEEIIRLTLESRAVLERKQSGTRLTLNVAPFVPKAGTPFQWLPMASLPTLDKRLTRLKSVLPAKGIKVKSESPAWSQVQAVLARGDWSLAGVLESTAEVTLAGWRKAVEKCRLDADYYAHQRWDTGQALPWGMIDSRVKAGQLERGMEKAVG